MSRQQSDTQLNPGPLSLRSRTLVFAVLLTLSSVVGIVLLLQAQESLTLTSFKIREHYLPTARLLDRARSEINFQLQDLGYLNAGLRKTSDPEESSSQISTRISSLRPPPAVRALNSLYSSKLLPEELGIHFQPWTEKLREYETFITQSKEIPAALSHLRELKTRTDLLQRAVDRELSLLILSNQENSRLYLIFWSLAFFVGLLTTFAFIFLVWQWMKPLQEVTHWLEKGNFQFPPKAAARGWFGPPLEVENLVQILRKVIYRFSEQGTSLEEKTKLAEENERTMQILLSGYLHVLRHNEELIAENIRREKLASMGEMAAELAHEIRNPLNGMNLKLELLKSELDPSKQVLIDRIIDEIDRLDALTESHLRTARSRVLPLQSKPMADTIQLTLEDFAERLKKSKIHCRLDLDSEVPLGKLPENILKAVLVNLIKNAIEAIEEKNETEKSEEGLLLIHLKKSKSGLEWILAVHDSGVGFPKEILKRPIQSFSTSKVQGSGLGLATAQKMLKAYGVELKIISPNPPHASSLYLIGSCVESSQSQEKATVAESPKL